MESSTANQITTPGNQNFFLSPQFPMQRQYEALRAYLVEEESSADVARRFGGRGALHRGLRSPLRLFPRRLPRPVLSVPPRSSKTRLLLPPTATWPSILSRPRPRP